MMMSCCAGTILRRKEEKNGIIKKGLFQRRWIKEEKVERKASEEGGIELEGRSARRCRRHLSLTLSTAATETREQKALNTSPHTDPYTPHLHDVAALRFEGGGVAGPPVDQNFALDLSRQVIHRQDVQ
jgi:hypothetical protein